MGGAPSPRVLVFFSGPLGPPAQPHNLSTAHRTDLKTFLTEALQDEGMWGKQRPCLGEEMKRL